MPKSFVLPALAFALLAPLLAPLPALADQAECEKTVRALLFPLEENKPDKVLNRFGTVSTIINGAEQKGFSLQTPEGSVYYDQDKNPTSLSFSTGETFWTPDGGTSG